MISRSGEETVLRCMTVAVALVAAVAARSAGQGTPDTAVTVFGFVERADSGGWQLMLPQPLTVEGRRVNLLSVRGDAARLTRLQDRFVRAAGLVTLQPGGAVFEAAAMGETEPDGTGRSDVHLSFNESAVVKLSAIPNRIVWRLADGQPSGVQPLLMYSVLNIGQTPIEFVFRTNDVLCVEVKGNSAAEPWRTALPAPTHNQERIVIRLGGIYRQFAPIPPEAAPAPGRYTTRVTLCGVADYAAETQFEVRSPAP